MGTDRRTAAGGGAVVPQQISALVLRKLKLDAESYLGERVTDAVITLPACFTEHQRQAVMEAGRIAGLNVLRVIDEPTSAALAYHLEKDVEAMILVFDLGGGSLSTAVAEVGDGVVQVLATDGDHRLGGDDWDDAVAGWLVTRFRTAHGIDLSRDRTALERLREAAEKAKIELSSAGETRISLPYITGSAGGLLHLDERLTRAEFQRMTSGLLDRCKIPFQRVVEAAGIGVDEIDQVLLVGAATRMPAVSGLVRELTGKDPGSGVDPRTVVALGAGVQAGILKGHVKHVMPLGVVPLSLGIETRRDGTLAPVPEGGILNKIIQRDTTIPTKRSETFTTAEDDQASVEIHVYQGEREIAAHNRRLGTLRLTGLPPVPRGVPQIEVTVDIDANGIIGVSAKDLGTGQERSVVITVESALPEDDIERMAREARRYA
jgi:molecular chaperone DnaK